MTDIFDDPFFIATVNAQTRAMNKFEVDYVHLERETTKRLYNDFIANLTRIGDVAKTLEFVLDMNEPFVSNAERGGYKIAIGMAWHEVRRARKLQLEEFERAHPLHGEQDT